MRLPGRQSGIEAGKECWQRVLRGSLVLLLALLPVDLRGGHTLLIHIGVYDPLRSVEKPGLLPVALGVPVPQAAGLKDLDRIALVGAEAAQFQPLSRWPNGAVRWLFIDALVRLDPGQAKAALHLTTGQATDPQTPLALRRANGDLVIDTGAASFVIPAQGDLLVRDLRAPQGSLSNGTIRLSAPEGTVLSVRRAGVQIEKNGPVAAVMLIAHELTMPAGPIAMTTRVGVFRGQSWLKLENAVGHPGAAAEPVTLPRAAFEFEEFPSAALTAVAATSSNWRFVRLSHGTNGVLVGGEVTRGGVDLRPVVKGIAWDLFSTTGKTFTLRPGALWRRELYLDLQPDQGSMRRIAHPLIAIGASPDAYNDAETLVETVIANDRSASTAGSGAAASFTSIERSIYRLLGQTDPADAGGFGKVQQSLDELLEAGLLARSLPGEALSLWSFLTGDECVRQFYLTWGQQVETAARAAPAAHENPAALAQFLDYYRVSGDLRIRDWVVDRVESWLAGSLGEGNSQRDPAAKFGRETLVLLASLIRHGQLPSPAEDRLLDLLESVVLFPRRESKIDRVFSEGFLLTGQASFLEDGARFLARAEAAELISSIAGMLSTPQRHHVWRDLALQKQVAADGAVTLSWTVPARALRMRVKHANLPIGSDAQTTAAGAVSFPGARNLDGEPPLAAAGSPQSMRLGAAAGLAPHHFAARYLERGAALPGRTLEPAQNLTPDNESISGASLWSSRLAQCAAASFVLATLWYLRRRWGANRGSVLLLLALAALGSSCGSDADPSAQPSAALLRRSTTTDGGNYVVAIQPRPEPIPMNEHFALEITITVARAGVLTSDLAVTVDASMPAHGHGLNTEPRVSVRGSNRFVAEGLLFHMAGAWELYIDVGRGPVRERASFPLTLRP